MIRTRSWTLAAIVLVTWGANVHPQNPATAPLRGISAFVLDIQVREPFDAPDVRAMVDSLLEGAMISTISSDLFEKTQGAAGLRVTLLQGRERRDSHVAGMVLVEVVERGSTVRAPASVGPVVTWRNGGSWLASTKGINDAAESALGAALATLIDAYQLANPRER